MLEKISQDIKEAMKARDSAKLEVLRMLKSRLLENKTSNQPRPEMDVVIGYFKMLKDSADMYPEGSEQKGKVLAEMQQITPYMPAQLEAGDVEELVKKFLESHPDANFGQVMKDLSPKIKGKFDGKAAAAMVKSLLDH